MPGCSAVDIGYSKRLSREQHQCRADADWAVLNTWSAYWRNQANKPTIEPSVCGGDAALSNYFDHLL